MRVHAHRLRQDLLFTWQPHWPLLYIQIHIKHMVLRQLIFVCIRSKRACNLCGACAFHILATRTVPLNCTMHSVCRSTWTALHCGIGLIFHLRMPHNTIIHKIWLVNSASWSYHTHNATKLLGQMSSLFRQAQTALWKAWLIFFDLFVKYLHSLRQ